MWFVLFGLILLAGTISITINIAREESLIEGLIVGALCLGLGGFVAFGCVYGMSYLTTGLFGHYSTGMREGYITKLSVRGVIWKTNEGEMQIGAGEMAALQEPYRFSVPDEETFASLAKVTGRRVRLHYKQWLIMPAHVGESSYEITRVEVLNDQEQH